jgi:predicted transposase YbfD/YdcC
VAGQAAAGEKSNEITAIPQVLDMIDITVDVVTVDAIGCQTAIAAKTRQKQADYALAVKENQPALYEDIRDYFAYLESKEGRGEAFDSWGGGSEKDHGRVERRNTTVVTGLGWLEGGKAWKDRAAIIRRRSSRGKGLRNRPVLRQQHGRARRNIWACYPGTLVH